MQVKGWSIKNKKLNALHGRPLNWSEINQKTISYSPSSWTWYFFQRKGNVEWILIHFSEARGRILIAGMRILPSFFPPKTAPKSKVWRGHLRQGSQDFIDCINGLGNFRGISGLIHPDQAVFHWEFWICHFFWIFPPPSAAQMQCNCFPAIRIRSANQRIENKNNQSPETKLRR